MKFKGTVLTIIIFATLFLSIFGKVQASSIVKGDINGDGEVNLKDLVALALAYGSQPGDSRWNAKADLDVDGSIDRMDLAIFVLNYGEGVPAILDVWTNFQRSEYPSNSILEFSIQTRDADECIFSYTVNLQGLQSNFSTSTSNWTNIIMDKNGNTFNLTLDTNPLPYETFIFYKISALDNSGNSFTTAQDVTVKYWS